jgi:F-type H+-transporting ATPase subunit b
MLKIPPDYTFLVEIVIFVALWLAMKRLWFDPALRIISERKARTEGAIEEARTIQLEAERLRAQHATAVEAARDDARREMEDTVRRAEEEQRRLIAEAREQAQQVLADARGRIAEDIGLARRAVGDQARAIAHEVVQKILGRTP